LSFHAATSLRQKIPAVKAIVSIGVIVLVALGIFAVLSLMQRQSTGKMIQEDATGFFREKQQEAALANTIAREAFNESNPVKTPTGVSGPSWLDSIQNAIEDCVRAIKNLPTSLSHRARPAPPGVYFTLIYFSVPTRSGITGLSAGTQVVCVKDEGPVLLVKAGKVEFEAQRQYLTNDFDVADLALRNDAEAQQALASYIAQQQQAIAQQEDGRKVQASGRR
jgi:hypothetical protein